MFSDGNTANRKYDLEARLLEFASAIIDLSEQLPSTRAGNHVAGQILRSGTSPYPNHGEAEDAESRETCRWARLIRRKGWAKETVALVFVLGEAEELIRIFFASVQTAKKNALAEKRQAARGTRYPSGDAG